MYRDRGIKGFWRGSSPTFYRNFLGGGIFFLIVEKLKSVDSNTGSAKKLSHDLINSAIARSIATTIVSPFTLIKTRMEAPGFDKYKNTFDGVIKIFKKEGILGF